MISSLKIDQNWSTPDPMKVLKKSQDNEEALFFLANLNPKATFLENFCTILKF